jgi:hypothetical protein
MRYAANETTNATYPVRYCADSNVIKPTGIITRLTHGLTRAHEADPGSPNANENMVSVTPSAPTPFEEIPGRTPTMCHWIGTNVFWYPLVASWGQTITPTHTEATRATMDQ